ncbi:MAG: S-layer homology domain-containing protein, partial [Oscillospiraceae bacterium]|nr:S-layer homology domain-containing protein [Oscillospiraceae bacterium]
LWAVENGITNGMDATHFNPGAECTRAQVVTFLWRAKGSPAADSSDVTFTDVQSGAFYSNAVAWAVENGVTSGMGDGTFGVNGICNRAQVVTFLYRAMA